MLNVITIMGRLARDPEMRQTTTGKSVCSFTIACDRGRKDSNGKNLVDWISVVAWEHTAEFICKYFQKGQMIVLDGRLQSRTYKDRDGNNRTAIEIVASSANFAGPKSQQGNPEGGYASASGEPNVQFDPIDDDEGDLPF